MGSDEIRISPNIDLSHVRIKENSLIARLAAAKLNADKVAVVLGRTINLYNVSKNEFLKNNKWVKHEICHIRQFETNGYFTFVFKYLWESLRRGYFDNKYEVEARLAEEN